MLLTRFLAALPFNEQSKAVFLEGYRLLGLAREMDQNPTGALKAYLKVLERDAGFSDVLERAMAIERKGATGA